MHFAFLYFSNKFFINFYTVTRFNAIIISDNLASPFYASRSFGIEILPSFTVTLYPKNLWLMPPWGKIADKILYGINNPPFSWNVATNIGRKFLNIFKDTFTKNHVQHKMFKRNTCKVSYSCVRNINAIIKNHNAAMRTKVNRDSNSPHNCNCRVHANCSMNGACLKKNLVYQAAVTSYNDNRKETNIDML